MATGVAGKKIGRRILGAAAAIGVLWFAVQGGEFGTTDLYAMKARRRALEADVASMKEVVDSLVTWKKQILTEPAVQERIAREEFGMVRGNKELLYRFIDAK
jgi:cell division protein FtsB